MLDPDRFFSLGLSWTGPSVILNSDTEFIMIALIGFSSPCFSLVSCVSKMRKEHTHHKLTVIFKRTLAGKFTFYTLKEYNLMNWNKTLLSKIILR